MGAVGGLGAVVAAPMEVGPPVEEAKGGEGAGAVPSFVVAEGIPTPLAARAGARAGAGGAEPLPVPGQARVGEARTAAEAVVEAGASAKATVGAVAAQDGAGAAVGVATGLLGAGPTAEVAPLATFHRPLGVATDRTFPCGAFRVAGVGARTATSVQVPWRLVRGLGAGGLADLATAFATVGTPSAGKTTAWAAGTARLAAVSFLQLPLGHRGLTVGAEVAPAPAPPAVRRPGAAVLKATAEGDRSAVAHVAGWAHGFPVQVMGGATVSRPP